MAGTRRIVIGPAGWSPPPSSDWSEATRGLGLLELLLHPLQVGEDRPVAGGLVGRFAAPADVVDAACRGLGTDGWPGRSRIWPGAYCR